MNERILIIEDDPSIMSILEMLFEEEGFRPILNVNGTNIEEVSALLPDLILLDIRIAGSIKTGAEICAELKSSAAVSHIPVVLVSAETNLDVIARNCHADAYVSKPFDINVLLAKVRELLN